VGMGRVDHAAGRESDGVTAFGHEIFEGFSRSGVRLANGSSVARVARPWSDLLAHY
jgi:hypothetical protein